jgi:FMN-dependent NADH-azoreductase
MNILQVNSSARPLVDGAGSHSTRLANELVAGLLSANPAAQATVRDLTRHPHPALDEDALQALFTPDSQRTPAQAARVALDDALIAEIQAADVVVLAAPMYNFGVSTQLKNWIDAIARARVTFRYTERGVEGLLKGKTVHVVLTRGGVHRDQASDTMVPYLRTVLGFLGMTDVRFAYAEGLAMGPDAEAAGLARAREDIAQITGIAQPVEA